MYFVILAYSIQHHDPFFAPFSAPVPTLKKTLNFFFQELLADLY